MLTAHNYESGDAVVNVAMLMSLDFRHSISASIYATLIEYTFAIQKVFSSRLSGFPVVRRMVQFRTMRRNEITDTRKYIS